MMRLPEYNGQTARYTLPGGLSRADPPAMSDEQFHNEIRELAHKHATSGVKTGHLESDYQNLAQQYTSVVSPDRRALIANAAKTSTIPVNLTYIAAEVYDNDGFICAHYCHTVGWSTNTTPQEKDRVVQFQNIYRAAYDKALVKE